MAWSWSHTQEAYDYAEQQIRAQPREWLEVVFAEWRAQQGKRGQQSDDNNLFNERKYNRALAYAKQHMSRQQLADYIWKKAEELRTCTNGGWQAYACPYGCGPHLVRFSPEEEPDE